MCKKNGILIILICFLSFKVMASGEITSSGGEFVTTENNPWFIGSDPVKYCVIRNEGFSVDMQTSRAVVKDAISDWTSTLKLLNLKPTPVSLFDGVQKNITLDFRENDCSHNTDLWFYFGEITEEIRSVLKHHARYTAAFAGRVAIDDYGGRSPRGLIWLAPDLGDERYQGPSVTKKFWSSTHVLSDVLLHEIGHVFGFEHHPDGVMNTGFPAFTIQKGGYGASSKVLIHHKWPEINGNVCIQDMQIPSQISRELLKTNLVVLWQICLTSKHHGLFDNDIQISFESEEGLVKKDFLFKLKEGYSKDASWMQRGLVGNYRGTSQADYLQSFNFHHHYFLRFVQSRYKGHLVDMSESMSIPLIISKNESFIELNFILQNEFLDLSFYIDNFDPNFETNDKLLKTK